MTKPTYAAVPNPGWKNLVISFYTKDGNWFTQSWVTTDDEIRVGILDQSYFVILVGGNGDSDVLDKLRYVVYPNGVVKKE